MKSEIKIEKTVTLKLTEEEALWLKGVVQNPVIWRSKNDESGKEYDMRMKFWDAVKGVGDLPQVTATACEIAPNF